MTGGKGTIIAHRGLRIEAMDELKRVRQVLGDRNGPVGPPALERRGPDLVRLEVDVARAYRERFAHPAPGQREGLRESLNRGLRIRPDRGEEALAIRAQYFRERRPG